MFFPRPKTVLALLALAPLGCSSVEYAASGTTEMGDVGDDISGSGSDSGATGESTGEGGEAPDAGEEDPSCDPWAQDCPTGEKCTFYDDGYGQQTRCVPVDPEPKGAGEVCQMKMGAETGVDDCDAGLLCKYLDENGIGVCVELCGGTPDDPTCSDPNAMCSICHDGCASVCAPTCDPLASECAEGQVCAPTNEGVFVCTPSGANDDLPGGQGEPCAYANECADGFACVPGTTVPECIDAYCCAPYCDLGGNTECPGNTICVPWNDAEDAPSEYQHVGVCALP